MEGVRVSMDCLLPGYSVDRPFVRMELHKPVSLSPLQNLKVFLEFFAVVFCSEGEIYVFGVLCHVVYVDQEGNRPQD